jgi:hypothetical protein
VGQAAPEQENLEPRLDFFISYTGADRAWAEWIGWQLEQQGYSVFLQSDLSPGDNWVARTRDALNATQCLLAVLSPAYLQSSFAAEEWRHAVESIGRGGDFRLLPVRVAPMELPEEYNEFIYVDLVDLGEKEARDRLLKAARRDQPRPSESTPYPGQPMVPKRPLFPEASDAPEHEADRKPLPDLIDDQLNLVASTLAGYEPDTVRGIDRLGIGGEVNALCAVLAARGVEPPLSVGLFGDWGSGKSFFMEQMRRRIRELAGRSSKVGDDETLFCRYVRQITFNAWHYADANLWASLVTHIFDSLASTEQEDEAAADEQAHLKLAEQRAQLVARLGTTETLVRETEEKLKAANGRTLAAEQRLQEFRDRSDEQVAQIKAEDLRGALSEELAPELDAIRQELGVDRTLDELPQLASELQDTVQRVKYVWGRVRTEGRERWIIVIALISILAAGGLAWLLRERPGLIQGAGAALVVLTGTLVNFMTFLKGPLAQVRDAADRTMRVLSDIEQRRKERRIWQEEQLQKVLSRRIEVEGQLEQEAWKARQETDTLRVQLAELRSGRQLYRFVHERSTSTDYRQHLGVVAMIRRDFEQMSTLLRRNVAVQDQLGDDTENLRLDRIILYIDDLDRCRADRVVQVLEAVHLLLALPLFVVVVGVDPRWLLRSLEHHYAALLAPSSLDKNGDAGAETGDDADHWASTPLNYLEKIFQIPYTLRPMETAGYGRLISELMPVSPSEQDVPSAPPTSSESTQTLEGAPAASPQDLPASSTAMATPIGEQPLAASSEPIDLKPEALLIDKAELEFMKLLAPMITTPRAAKRFANVYRLLRASLPPSRLSSFVGTNEYQTVLLLLAVLVGFPGQAPALFEHILNGNDQERWWDFIEGWRRQEGLRISRQEATAMRRLFDCLNLLRADERVTVDTLAPFRRWVLVVARYSFHTGRLLVVRQYNSANAPDV